MILFLSPSAIPDLEMTEGANWVREFNLPWIYKNIEILNNKNLDSPQLLIIVDDQIEAL